MSVVFLDLKSGRKAECADCLAHLNLLAHAQMIELDVGSECGGHGICGKDRIRISSENPKDFSRPTEEERRHLSSEEIQAGWRLACQCYPGRDDLEITVDFNSPTTKRQP